MRTHAFHCIDQDDSAFVKGQSAISYGNLPKPVEVAKKISPLLVMAIIVAVVALGVGAYFYFHLFH